VDRFEVLADMIGALRPDEVTISVQRALESVVRGRSRVLVIDYAQTSLVELVGTPAGHRESFAVEATVAGRAYTTGHHQDVVDEAGCRLWLPLLQGAHRIGVLEIQTLTELTPAQRSSIDTIAAVLAAVLSAGSLVSDALPVTRRLLPMEVAAEIVWGLLPPLTFVNNDVSVAGILEPCYDVGGDAFDYAVNSRVAHVALFDAVGHGLAASRLSSLTVAAYRNARRSGLDLAATAHSIDAVLQAQAPPNHFVTALLAELDLDSGHYRRISAGHPGELLARGGKVIRRLTAPSWTPLGLGYLGLGEPQVLVEPLEPGDHLLLYSDGTTEARNATGELFGENRLGDYLVKALADALPAAETMRRLVHALLEYQNDQLQDDATAVLVGWRTSATQP
jgi:sigma-B regulation protein RsbU (phosphoserine phosphatase)